MTVSRGVSEIPVLQTLIVGNSPVIRETENSHGRSSVMTIKGWNLTIINMSLAKNNQSAQQIESKRAVSRLVKEEIVDRLKYFVT